MLTITVPESRIFNQKTQEFIYVKETTLKMEHSLVSIHKWEQMYCKPFIETSTKTTKETIDYIKCMTITQNVPEEVFYSLTTKNLLEIQAYIDSPMTATVVTDPPGKGRHEILTAEVIYYYMIAFQIPVEFEKWHLNSLLMLIKVCNAKNQPPKKMSKSEILSQQQVLNEQRRLKLGSNG